MPVAVHASVSARPATMHDDCSGTLTPLAKMFSEEHVDEMESKVLPKVGQVVVMGGAVDVPGNLFSKPTNVKAEFNIYNVRFSPREQPCRADAILV